MPSNLKTQAQQLRAKGKTYSEIKKILGIYIPKGTLSAWCRDIKMSLRQKERIAKINEKNLAKGRVLALKSREQKRGTFFKKIDEKNKHLEKYFHNKNFSKIILAILYLAEGSKSERHSIMFGNSDPFVIRLFIRLLKICYKIDKKKFRCTLQGRADQPISQLEKFWSKITGIPLSQFYSARIDPRSIGKKSLKPNYKGVCRIDYFSAALDLELKRIVQLMHKFIV